MIFKKEDFPAVIQQFCEDRSGKAVAVKHLGGGSYGLVYEVTYGYGKTEIIKVFYIEGTARAETAMRSEADALRLLRNASPVKVPEVFYVHSADEQCPLPFIAMERIDGVPAGGRGFLYKSRKKRKTFAKSFTDALGQIHETTHKTFGFVHTQERFDTWQAFYKKHALAVYEKAKAFREDGKLDNKIFVLLEKGIQNFDCIFSEKVEKASLIHGDFYVMNLLVNKKTLAPVGIIDPFLSMWGDREYDLFALNAMTGARLKLFETYKKKFKTTRKVELKSAFYALVFEVFHHLNLGWCTPSIYKGLAKRLKRQYRKFGIR
jgi:fructosamine-3-kinase